MTVNKLIYWQKHGVARTCRKRVFNYNIFLCFNIFNNILF